MLDNILPDSNILLLVSGDILATGKSRRDDIA